MKIIFTYYPLFVNWNHGVNLLVNICRSKDIRTVITPINSMFLLQIKKHAPDWVGFSFVTEDDYIASLPYAKEVQKMGIKLIAGGVYAKIGGHIDNRIFEHVCRGEGERLPDFLLNGDESALNGYVHADIDKLPLCDYSGLTGFEFNRPQYGYSFLNGLKILPYSTSRGCSFTCNFCAAQLWKQSVRFKRTIRKELDFLMDKYNPDMFYITDELMPYYRKDWLNQWRSNKHPFFGMIRADIKPDALKMLIDNGLKFTVFGVESGDEVYRNGVLHKELKDSDIRRTVGILKSNNIIYSPFFMRGTPYETDDIMARTDKMKQEIGGWPVVFPYIDIRKKAFSIPDIDLDKYCKKTGTDKTAFLDNLNKPEIHGIANDNGFLIYEKHSDSIYVREVFGNGQYWIKEKLPEICRQYGLNKFRGHVKHAKALQKRYNVKTVLKLVECEVM